MTAQITLTPATAKPGDSIKVAGTGWGWRYYVYLTLDGPKIITTALATVKTTTTKGAFTATVTIPKVDASGLAIPAGAYTVHATSRRPASASAALTITLPVPADPPPVISGIVARKVTQTSVEFAWHVSEPAQGWVEAGLTTAYGLATRHETTLNYSDHIQPLAGLAPGTTYHYRVHAIDAAGQHVVSADLVLLTLPATVPVPVPTPTPTPPPTSTSGIPAVPAGGDLLTKDFADGHLNKADGTPLFRQVFYVDDHPGDFMGVACDYRGAPAAVITFPTDGGRKYLRMASFPKDPANPAGAWWAVLLSTGDDGAGHGPTFTIHTGYIQFASRVGVGRAAWGDPLWTRDDTPPWGGSEIDGREALEDGKLHYNVLGAGPRYTIGRTPPADPNTWVVSGIAIADDHVTFVENGVVLGRWDGVLEDMNLLADGKVGHPWAGILPDARTPNPATADLAWVTVSSKIPAGL